MELTPISAAPESKALLKKIKVYITNIPVFNNGTSKEARTIPKLTCFSRNNLKTRPATNPAIAVLVKQVMIVPAGLMTKNPVIVDGADNINAPSTNPKNNPPNGPNIIAPTAIGKSANVMETGPNWI